MDLPLDLAQVEEQLLLACGGAHFDEAPGAEDEFLDRRLDPPHGVSSEPETLVGFEALHRLHKAHISLRDDFRDRQAVAAVAHSDLGNKAQMGRYELVGGLAIAMLFPPFGEHVLFVGLQHWKLPDFLKVAAKATFAGNRRQSSASHVRPFRRSVQGFSRIRLSLRYDCADSKAIETNMVSIYLMSSLR